MKLHLPKALFAAVLAVVCGQAYAATYADWTISTDASGQTVFTTTQDGAYDINLGAAAISGATYSRGEEFTMTVETTKTDGWELSSANRGTIIASTSSGTSDVNDNGQFTLRMQDGTTPGAVLLVNAWDYPHPSGVLTGEKQAESLNTLGFSLSFVGTNASTDAFTIESSANSDMSFESRTDGNIVRNFTFSTLSNKGAGLSDYSTVSTTITVAKKSSTVSNVTIGNLTTADTAVTLNNVSMTGTLTATGTGSFTVSGNTNLSGLTPASSVIKYGESEATATTTGNGYAFGSYTYNIATAGSNVSLADGATFSNAQVTSVVGSFDSTTGQLNLTNGTAAGAYTINQGGTIAYTTGSAIASANTTSVVVNAASTLNMGSGTTLNHANLTANANVTLDGSGLYIAGSATTLGNKVSLADSWSGTVQLTGGLDANVNFLSQLAKNDATIEMKGVTGWGSNWAGEISQNLMLTNNGNDAAWVNGACYTDNTGAYTSSTAIFSGKWTGTGNFLTNINGARGMRYRFTGDISEWTGYFKAGANSDASVTIVEFGGNATDVNAVIQRDRGILRMVVDADVTFNKAINNAALLTINAGKTATLKQNLSIDEISMASGSTLNMTGKNLTVNAASTINNLTVQDMNFKQFSSPEAAAEALYTVTLSGTNTVNGLLDFSRAEKTAASVKVSTGSSLTHNGDNLWMSSTNAGILLEEGATFNRKTGFSVKGLSSEETSLGHIEWTNSKNGTFNGLDNANVTISNAELSVNANATISTGLNNVVIKNNGHALTMNTDAVLSGAVLTSALSINSGKTLTLSGTASYTGETQTRSEERTTDNGFGATITYANAFSGAGTVNSTATWTLNGTAATLNGKELSYSTDTNVYYINTADTITDVTADHIGNANGEITSDVNLIGDASTVGMKLTGTQTGATYTFSGAFTGTGNLVIEPTTPAADNLADTYVFSGAITHTGAIVATSNTEVVFNGNSTNITTALKAPNGHITAYYEHGKNVTVTGEINNNPWENKQGAIDLNVTDNTTVAFNGAVKADKLTVEEGSAAALNAESNLKDTVTVNGDLTVKAASTMKQLGGLGTVKALADLTVTEAEDGKVTLGGMEIAGNTTVTVNDHAGTLTLGSLTVTGSGSTINANLDLSDATVTLNGNSVELGCDLKFDGTAITLSDDDIAAISGAGLLLFSDVESLTLGTTTHNTDYIGLVDASGIILTLAGDATSALPDKVFVNFSATDKTVSLTIVPEPATATLSLLALAALAARRKRH